MHWSYAENLANECTNNRNATINVCGWKVKADSNTLRTDHENRDRKTEYNGQSSRRILFRVTLSEVGSRLSSIIQIGWFFFLFFISNTSVYVPKYIISCRAGKEQQTIVAI